MSPKPDPAALRQHLAALRAGVVLHLYQSIAGKEKFHVLIATSAERSLGFLINSGPSPFIQRQPDRLRRHVLMTKELHPFLHHDSYIACDDTVKLPPSSELVEGLCNGGIKLTGTIHASVHQVIGMAADGSKLIAPRDSELIARAFPK